jgi:integrase
MEPVGTPAGISWAADGRHLFFAASSAPAGKEMALWKIAVTEGAPEKVGPLPEKVYDVVVHPSGTRVAFSTVGVKQEVWVMENFLLYLTQERHLAWSSVSVAGSAIRFFYTHTVKRLDIAMAMPPRRKPRRLRHIRSVGEIERLLSTPRHPTHRVLLMPNYAAGLRVSEVVRLQLTDRSTILSPRLLTELDRYRAQRSLTRWLFPAHTGEQPMSASTAQHIFVAAKARAGIQHCVVHGGALDVDGDRWVSARPTFLER